MEKNYGNGWLEEMLAALPSGKKVYCNPEEYDLAIAHHPYLKEMKAKIFEIGKKHLGKNSRILEYGAGTGNLTETLEKLPFGHFLVTEDDKECFQYLKRKFGKNKRLAFKRADITKDSFASQFDAIFSCATDHHLPPNKKIAYLKNILGQLKHGGMLVVGDELLNEYKGEASRVEALKAYYKIIIRECLEKKQFGIAKIEALALKNGIACFDEYKLSKKEYLKNIKKAGFKLLLAQKMGPPDGHEHGVYVVVAQKP